MPSTRILIVEDDHEIARLTAMYLNSEGYDTKIINDGALALDAINQYQPALLILDLMLPGLSGIEICTQARTFFKEPILVLTACNDELSEVNLLQLGADDYLTKPVRPHVMAARINALLRRSKAPKKPNYDAIELKRLKIDPRRQRVEFRGEVLELTDSEYDLLLLLTKNVGKIISREECCQQLRGIDHDFSDRSIDMRISGLRKKLNVDCSSKQLIKTVRNKGYMLLNE
ncbi:MAG: response regulator transcription factor [Moritella sp.]|uniref:response regulator transcription factor n=1 Tax=Moritella sp. TaxID=78556 RepID=UPI0029A9F80B|nr:response regulator transcription factor [Moritella sp.]MDX2320504.1 response regulator transcription factor [Moritella sp.]